MIQVRPGDTRLLVLLVWATVALGLSTLATTEWIAPAFPALEREMAVVVLLTVALAVPPGALLAASMLRDPGTAHRSRSAVFLAGAIVESIVAIEVWLYLHGNPLADSVAAGFEKSMHVASAAKILLLACGIAHVLSPMSTRLRRPHAEHPEQAHHRADRDPP